MQHAQLCQGSVGPHAHHMASTCYDKCGQTPHVRAERSDPIRWTTEPRRPCPGPPPSLQPLAYADREFHVHCHAPRAHPHAACKQVGAVPTAYRMPVLSGLVDPWVSGCESQLVTLHSHTSARVRLGPQSPCHGRTQQRLRLSAALATLLYCCCTDAPGCALITHHRLHPLLKPYPPAPVLQPQPVASGENTGTQGADASLDGQITRTQSP